MSNSHQRSWQNSSAPSSNAGIDSMTDHLFLPSKEELDKLLRYEAMINRQLNHAIAELERLQRRRNGESVPAPISVDISGRDSAFLQNTANKFFNFSCAHSRRQVQTAAP